MSPQERTREMPERLKDCCDHYEDSGLYGQSRCNCGYDRIDHALRRGWVRELQLAS